MAIRVILMQGIIQAMDASIDQRDDDLNLSDMFGRAVRYWWLVAVFMVVGGIAGYLLSVLGKPVYESTAEITTVIDFAYSGKLTDYEEDHLLSAIGDVLQSDDVMQIVVTEGVNSGLAATPEDMRIALTASRQGFRWELSSRFDDPQNALAANRSWLNTAMQKLEAFRLDSLIALAEYNNQVGIENCFQQAVVVEPVSVTCSLEEFQAMRDHLRNLEDGSIESSLLTRLLASRISFQVTQEPDLPTNPVHLGRNLTVLAGVIVGLLLSVILLLAGLPRVSEIGNRK